MSSIHVGSIVLSSTEYENLLFLKEKGPSSKEILPNDSLSGLLNQQLVEEDEGTLAITSKGAGFLDDFAAKLQSEKDEEESADEEESTELEEEVDPETAKRELKRTNEATQASVDSMAMESLSLALTNAVPAIVNGFTAIINSIKPETVGIETKLDTKSIVGKINDYPYVNLSQLPLPVPEGMNVKYHRYLEALDAAVTRTERLQSTIDNFIQYTSDILTNSTSRLKTDFNQKGYQQIESEREALYAGLGACFLKGANHAALKYNKVVDRNREWAGIYSKATDLAVRINSIDRKKLLKTSNHLKELLNKVKQTAERGGFDVSSPEVIKNLSEGSYQVASELEFYAVCYYRLQVLAAVLKQDSEVLAKATNLS